MSVPRELLSEGQRGGVLSMGAADLDDVSKFLGFCLKFCVQSTKTRKQDAMGFKNSCDVHNGGEAVIA